MRCAHLQSFVLGALLVLGGCAERATPPALALTPPAPTNLDLFDAARSRPVPVALYGARTGRPKPLAVVSHGYGGKNTDYGFIARWLAEHGFIVASIQQDLPGDPAPASQGNLRELRRPIWQRGAETILYVARELRARKLANSTPLVLVGHSNGGDTVMLFATEHPELARTAISLDNRRMPIPRTKRPRICSLRSSDFPADQGVLPDPHEQRASGMLIERVPVGHNDMWDGATEAQKKVMLDVIATCLDGKAGRSSRRARRPSPG